MELFLALRGQPGGAGEHHQDERSHLAVVACGPRLEETLTMLKSALLLSRKPLHFYIFAEEDLHDSFRNTVSVLLCNTTAFLCVFVFLSPLFTLILLLHLKKILPVFSWSWTPGPEQQGLVSPSTPSRFPVSMGRSGRSSSNLVPPSGSSCQWVYNPLLISVTSSGSCERVSFVACVPADPEGCGFFALRGHRHHIPAAGGGDLGAAFSF